MNEKTVTVLKPDIDVRVVQCDLTNYCNLQCIMCTNLKVWKNNKSYEKKVMSDAVWDRICEVNAKEIWLGIAGETSLDRGIWQKIDKYHRLHPDTYFSMITNGINFNEDDIARIGSYPFRVVNVSLNGGDRKTVSTIMGFHVWDQSWWTINHLLNRVHVVISSVFLYQNSESIYKLIDLVSELKTDRVSVCIGFPNQTGCYVKVPTQEEYNIAFKSYEEYGLRKGVSIRENKKEFDLEDPWGFDNDYRMCSKLWRRIYIDVEGNLFYCCERWVHVDNVKNKPVMEIYKGYMYDVMRHLSWYNEGICKGCRVIDHTKSVYPLFVKEAVRETLQKYERIAVFGAGEHTTRLFDETDLKPQNIVAIFDNDPKKTNTPLSGVNVYSPDAINTINPDAIIVSSLLFETDISEQLKALGVPDEKIITLYRNRF